MPRPFTPSVPDPDHDSHRAFPDASSTPPQTPPAPGLPYAAVPGSSPTARSTRRSWALAGTGLLLVGAAGFAASGMLGGSGLGSSRTQHQTYRQPVTALSFTGGSGDVTISGGAPSGTVEITRRLRWGPIGPEPVAQERWEGMTLQISAECPAAFLSGCSIDYEVKVPNTAHVKIDVGSGDTTLGGEFATVSVVSGSGDTDAKALDTASLFVKSGSGDLALDLGAVPAQTTLKTGSGDVDVRVPRGGPYAVDVRTGSGDKDIRVDEAPDSGHTISAETGSGDVSVAYR